MAQNTQVADTRRTNLTGSAAAANQFRQPLQRFRDELANRRDLWARLQPEQRATIEAKDPVLQLARELYDELKEWFDGR